MVATAVVAWVGCANPGTPTGGPRDKTPPVVLGSVPENGAQNFNGSFVVIRFDENVQLKDADKKFVMSPPMQKAPKVEAHGKEVKVTFDGELMPGTTYTLDFADCLSDLNEGNVYKDLTFTFSTGESTDTMMVSGNLYDAKTLSPVEGVFVMLHADLSDTALTKVVPIRIAKTDAFGRFAIKNVKAETAYRVFALEDQNRNFLFDQSNERVAWQEATVTPGWEMRQKEDSVKTDSTVVVEEDSVRWIYRHFMKDTLVFTPDSMSLFLFEEDRYEQYITSDSRKERNKVKLTLNKPMRRKPKVSFVGHDTDSTFAVVEVSQTNDTVTVWMTDTTIWKKDSVVLAVNYLVLDSLGQFVERTDTLKEWHYEVAKKEDRSSKRRRRKEPEKPKTPSLSLSVPGKIAPFGSLPITSKTPFQAFDWGAVRLSHKVDTLYQEMPFTPEPADTVNLCRQALKAQWIPGDTYRLVIDSAATADIYGLANKEVKQDFQITTLDQYGTLYIDVDSIIPDALLQLTSTKGDVLRQRYVPASGKVGFRYLRPGEYMVRLLIDTNRNGKWDTGDYAKKQQPERFFYLMKKIKVRANWTIQEDFKVGDFKVDAFSQEFGDKTKKRKK